MKSFLGFKDKAASAAKSRAEWAGARVASAVQRPPDFGRPSPSAASSSSSSAAPRPPSSAASAKQEAADGGAAQSIDPVLDHLMHNARSDAVRQEFLRGDLAELIDHHEIRLLVGTYNVNGRKPPLGLDLKPWLAAAPESDVVVAGFQEIVPLNASNVMNDLVGGSGEAAFAWDRLVGEALNPAPIARSYSCSDGHLVAAPQPESSDSAGNQPQHPAAATGQPEQRQGSSASTMHAGRSASAGANSPLDAAADQAVRDADAAGPGRGDAQDGAGPAARPAPPEAFVQVAAKQMVGVYLSVWVRAGLLPHIRGVQATSVGTGIMGYLGNKGAVAARLRLYDTGLCLVAAHLSSGEGDGDELRRNYDYSEIVRRAAFPPDSSASVDPEALDGSQLQPEGVSKVAAPGRRPGQWGAARSITDAEHCLWLGDLNYRLTLPDAEARAALRKDDLAALADADELSIMRRTGRAFEGWQEGPLSFPPTFKFLRGTMQYHGEGPEPDPASPRAADEPAGDAAAQQKKRTPAWTDRVLWRSAAIRQLSYGSAMLTASDHMPVAATFSLPVQEYNRERVVAAVEDARRRVDAAEMAAMPHCELEPPTADFGTLRYGQQAACDIVLRNIGAVTASFEFMPLPGAMFGDPADKAFRPAPRWASVTPEQGVLEPGAATDLRLTARVTGGPGSAADVLASEGRCKLEAIMVLRIQDGNDIFLAASGAYAPSFFGVSLSTLADLQRPLVAAAAGGVASAEGLAPANGSLRLDASARSSPKEPRGAGGNAEFYSPTSSLNSPMSEAGEPSTARRKLDPQLSKLTQPKVGSEDAAAAAGPETPADQTGAERQGGAAYQLQEAAEAEQDQLAALVRAAAAASESPAVLALVPPELRALTEYLRRPDVLQTPGLFVNRADHMSLEVAEESKIVREIREALDEGRPIPRRAGPHDVAATLLAFFASLPAAFMPPAAAQVCDVCVPSADAAASLLADALAPAEWAVFRHVAGLMRAALALEAAAANGLTAAALSALLSDLWFGPTPHSYKGKGGSMSPAEVEDLQRMAAGITAIAERRAAFLALFLEPPQ